MQPQSRSSANHEFNNDEALEWISTYIAPWLSNYDYTMNEDGSYHSESIIPPQVQQWLNLTLFRNWSQATLETIETIVRYLRNTSIGPTHRDHPLLPPPMNDFIRKEGIQIFGKNIYAPHGVHKVIKRGLEHTRAKGKLYQASPLSTSSDDSDSTPPKRARKTIARKKPPPKQPTSDPKETQETRLLRILTPSDAATVVFTGPPPNATAAEITHWVALWFRYHPTRTTEEGRVYSLIPLHPTPPWVQTWVNNARSAIANTSSNNPRTNALEAPHPALPVAASNGNDAPPQGASEEDIAEAVHVWLSTHIIAVNNGVIRCLNPNQTVPQYVQDRMAYNMAQIASMAANTNNPITGIDRTAPEENEENATVANNSTETEENAAIEIDAQGDTAEDPIILNESTSHSDNDSTEAEDKTN